MKKVIIAFFAGFIFATASTGFASTAIQKVQATLNGNINVTLDGENVNLKNTPMLYKGSTYLPLRETANILGIDVDWDNSTQTAILTSKGEKSVAEVNQKQKLWYNVEEVNAVFRPFFIGYDDDYKAIFTVDGVEYRVKQEVTVVNRITYTSLETLQQYLTSEQISKFKAYTIDEEGKEATPVS